MRIPVPRNRLIALTLLGIALTGALTLVLASPSILADDGDHESEGTAGQASVEATGDVPTPNPNFTPDVQQQSAYEEHEDDEHEDEWEEEDEEEHEEYEDDD
ncbi:hypothetical protein ACKVMT_08530 [Halobacteriales archaeon Cl-PHB]